ncbi:kinase-like domain-containing protein [Boletus reticuloceps]|uniref:Kinase-like domain-containing protein n=1 Tax=Boletus reticuloceps TaxID=495285 RepID=A0A8I2YVW6_9AGAM|nr:kinase-like domain-containing protein [Boletus reticuloceps]
MEVYLSRASQHRLNSRPKNFGLQKAAQVNEATAALKRQARVENLNIFVSIYLCPPDKSKAAKKYHIPNIPVMVEMQDNAEKILSQVLMKASSVYEESCKGNNMLMPSFDRDNAIFAVAHSTNDCFHLEQSYTTSVTVGQLYARIKTMGVLSDKDKKRNALSLRLLLNEPMELEPEGDELDEDFTTKLSIKSARKSLARSSTKVSTSSRRAKRPLLIESTTRLQSQDNGTTATGNSPKRYKSAYRPRVSSVRVEYEAFEFRRRECIIDGDGNVNIIQHKQTETILVAKNWQRFIRDETHKGGYIASGLSKFAFKGLYNSTECAVFQCKPFSSWEGSNEEDLLHELHLIHLASYFLQSFYDRAKVWNVKLPRITWNVERTFIGTVEEAIPPKPMDGSEDNRTLLFKTFLAAPLLSCDGLYQERKFCGNTDIPQNEDRLGLAIDAYIHHALVDSGKTVLLSDLQGIVAPDSSVTLFDPQAHTLERTSGHWDNGKTQIETYLEEHQCNAICRGLKLHSEVTQKMVERLGDETEGNPQPRVPSHPLRLGFESN